MSLTRALTPQMLKVFETLPELYLIMAPDGEILTASNVYLQTARMERDQLAGRSVFEAFPEQAATGGMAHVKASLQQVLTSRKPHQMAIIRYDFPHLTQKDQWEERYWRTSHTPVLDDTGAVQYIIHHTTDVAEPVVAEARLQVLEEQRRQAELRLEGQYNLLQTIIDQAPVAMSFFEGEEQVVVSANGLICR